MYLDAQEADRWAHQVAKDTLGASQPGKDQLGGFPLALQSGDVPVYDLREARTHGCSARALKAQKPRDGARGTGEGGPGLDSYLNEGPIREQQRE